MIIHQTKKQGRLTPSLVCSTKLVSTLVLVLASGLRLFSALHAWTLVVFLLSEIGHNTGLGTVALESFKSII